MSSKPVMYFLHESVTNIHPYIMTFTYMIAIRHYDILQDLILKDSMMNVITKNKSEFSCLSVTKSIVVSSFNCKQPFALKHAKTKPIIRFNQY